MGEGGIMRRVTGTDNIIFEEFEELLKN